MAVWFTSDTHFGHDGIIRHCQRPWIDSISMDVDLIQIWNKLVSPDDVVWHLGDFSFHRPDWRQDAEIVSKLNGTKYIIIGNHDNHGFMKKCGWNGVHDGIVEKTFEFENTKYHVVMSHYPLREWNGFYYGSFHLFGHVHGSLPGYCRSMDVGIDTNQYMPYSLGQVIIILSPKVNEHEDKIDVSLSR